MGGIDMLTVKQRKYLIQEYVDIIHSIAELKYQLENDLFLEKEAPIETFFQVIHQVVSRNEGLVRSKMEMDKIVESNKEE